MTKLRLLGAQRVKALTDILERKFKDKIAEVRDGNLSTKQATYILAEEIGVSELLREYEELETRHNEIKGELFEHLGMHTDLRTSYQASGFTRNREANALIEEIKSGDADEVIKKLQRELQDRSSQLWLVETLEEAQEIVNREIVI